jgi:hypothetical protein
MRRNSKVVFFITFFICSSLVSQGQEDLLPRQQPTVPEEWEACPHIETVPAPKLTAREKKQGFLLFSRPITEPVYKNTHPLPDERASGLQIFVTPGEFEPITFGIYPVRNLPGLRVTISDLTGENGVIPREELDLRLVTYWNIRYPYWVTDGIYRNVPELLEKVTVNNVKKEECQRYWIIAHIPGDAEAGNYKGRIRIEFDGLKKPVFFPVTCEVLDFVLRKDPHKHYSAYFSRPARQYRGMTGKLYETAVNNEIQAMRDYGFDVFPSITLSSDGDHAWVDEKMVDIIKKMLENGFSGPAPVDGEKVVMAILKKHEGLDWKLHWKLDHLPSDTFYVRLTRVFRQFRENWEEKGWPGFYLNPVDEVDISMQEFGVKVYEAVKKAGVKTYITKGSSWPDAPAYSPYVNAWCSQPFDVSYAQAVSGDYQYWCYPNHVAGERKNRYIMMRGGRMTYGFGYWRSGYTLLIPWHWRWITGDDTFEYIRNTAPCGMRMDEQGRIIPAIYWECFREGYDDGRYIYTLEQMIWERKGSPVCNTLVEESERLLKGIWDSIEVRSLYLDKEWPSVRFNESRRKIAKQISALSKYPAVRNVISPSVLPAVLNRKEQE